MSKPLFDNCTNEEVIGHCILIAVNPRPWYLIRQPVINSSHTQQHNTFLGSKKCTSHQPRPLKHCNYVIQTYDRRLFRDAEQNGRGQLLQNKSSVKGSRRDELRPLWVTLDICYGNMAVVHSDLFDSRRPGLFLALRRITNYIHPDLQHEAVGVLFYKQKQIWHHWKKMSRYCYFAWINYLNFFPQSVGQYNVKVRFRWCEIIP